LAPNRKGLLTFYESPSFFFYFIHIQAAKQSKNAHTCNAHKQNKTNDNNKASKNASHLLLSYIPLPSRGISTGRAEKQSEKKNENTEKERQKKRYRI
jgi:hypothetical protein